VPRHLRDGHYAGAKRLGHGEGYQYPHDAPGGKVDQDYLGVDKTYYTPKEIGFEIKVKQRLDKKDQAG
jgi:putative ATPase